MTDTDPRCAKCGHKRSQHHYRHPFEGPSVQDTIDTQDATIKALVEALRLADAALSGANMNIAVVERKVRAAIAAAEGLK